MLNNQADIIIQPVVKGQSLCPTTTGVTQEPINSMAVVAGRHGPNGKSDHPQRLTTAAVLCPSYYKDQCCAS